MSSDNEARESDLSKLGDSALQVHALEQNAELSRRLDRQRGFRRLYRNAAGFFAVTTLIFGHWSYSLLTQGEDSGVYRAYRIFNPLEQRSSEVPSAPQQTTPNYEQNDSIPPPPSLDEIPSDLQPPSIDFPRFPLPLIPAPEFYEDKSA